MKKYLFNSCSTSKRLASVAAVMLVLVQFQVLYAQNGIKIAAVAGPADPSAILDVVSGNKGVLLPRVALVSLTNNTTPINNPAAGLVVYNLGTGGVPDVGIYFWNGSSWVFLNGGNLLGSGTISQVSKFTAGNEIGNSLITDNGAGAGIGGAPVASAVLNITNTAKGFAMPRMTSAQRKAIVAPIEGLQVYDTDLKGCYYYTGTKWDCVSLPAGFVNFFGSNTPPLGYLACNAQAVNRTTYAELFAAIGTTYGAGDGSTTFNLPDLRGEFVRGVDNGRGVDVSRVFGSFQNFDWKGFWMTDVLQNASGGYSHNDVYMGKNVTPAAYVGNLFTGKWANPSASIGTRWDASEVRPRNVAQLACIKY